MADATSARTMEFKAEVNKLLDILVHSLYTNKEIFLRELISNASDAMDKLRFEATRGTEVLDPEVEPGISITTDAEAGRLTITDTGVGMTEDEVVENIGSIAHSGTQRFMEEATKSAESKMENLIGQFGVGFYSVFMVADKVELTTRSYFPEAKAVRWVSDGKGSYEIEVLEEDLPRGTTIAIHLREDAQQYAEPERLKGVIKTHSNFITFPISVDGEHVNTQPAIWREESFSVTNEQYVEFYKFLTFDTRDPLLTIHVGVDAPVQYKALLYIPPSGDNYFEVNREAPGIDLYARRVLIQHGNTEILPEWLGFMRGVVDSEDLPLNISRETLQENVVLRNISAHLVKQVLAKLEKLRDEDREKYEAFFREHGKVFKMGYADFTARDRFGGLLLFNASTHEDASGLMTLDEYIANAPLNQNAIYYAFGQSREAVESGPHLEIFRKKGVPVLYLYEPIDEFVMDAVGKHKDWEIKSVEHADLEKLEALPDTEETEKAEELSESDEQTFEKLLGRIKDILGEKVSEVRESHRLQDSPVCLVNPGGGMTSSMEKMIRLLQKDTEPPVKVMEVNKDHPLVRNLIEVYKADPSDHYIELASQQLYESALLLEGYLTDPQGLVKRIQEHLTDSSRWYSSTLKQ